MADAERNSGGERHDPLAKTREIVDLVLEVQLNDPQDLGRVLEAVGQVKADLVVLERYQQLAEHLGNGITTEDVNNAARHMQEAMALRPKDDIANENRTLVLAGLSQLRHFTRFNERVAQRPENGTNGIAIFQAGISPEFVDQAIGHVREAQQLILDTPRENSEPAVTLPSSSDPVEQIIVLDNTVVEPEDIPFFAPPDDFNSMQAGANASKEPTKASEVLDPKVQSKPRKIGRMSRRDYIKTAGAALVPLVIFGEATKYIPLTGWLTDIYENSKSKEQRELEHEEYMTKYSLSEVSTNFGNDWTVSYPFLEDNEEFTNVFNTSYHQLGSEFNTPIYAPFGENNPLLVATANVGFKVYPSRHHGTFSVVDSYSNWLILTGRKTPESLEQRRFPDIVQLRNTSTEAIFYLEVKRTKIKERNGTEKDEIKIRYMKKVKKSL